jgi:aminobenzoyl-glutamate transport protein
MIAPVDGVLTEITNDAIHLLNLGHSVYLTANLYFSVLSRIVLCIGCTIVTERIVEPRLGPYHSNEQTGGTTTQFASPSMYSLIVLITLIFLVTGLAYGRGARTVAALPQVMAAITKTFSGLGGLIFLFLVISQFLAHFNYSNLATVAAVNLADAVEHLNMGSMLLLIAIVVVTIIVGLIISAAIATWAILAPIFIPLFPKFNVAPELVLAANRVGDSPIDVLTPLTPYFGMIVACSRSAIRRTLALARSWR